MEKIRIYCENTGAHLEVEMGKTLNSLAAEAFTVSDGAPVLSALVDNKLKALDYKIINPHNVRFLDYSHPDGRRT